MQKISKIFAPNKADWTDPLSVFSYISETYDDYTFLYSGKNIKGYSGRFSILAYDKLKQVSDLEQLKSDKNLWFGYISYGVGKKLEDIDIIPNNNSNLPSEDFAETCFLQFKNLVIFDHEKKCLYHSDNLEIQTAKTKVPHSFEALLCRSDMDKNQYISKVEEAIKRIKEGRVYQINLTRKFFGKLDKVKVEDIFLKLCQENPSPYSSVFKNGELAVISSSPEQFIKFTEDNTIETRPIKGTSKKFNSLEDNNKAINELLNSKNKAENLMITDLMRNDLSRSAQAGSVKVENLFEVNSYTNVHQLSSTITAKKLPQENVIDCLLKTLPPGSMTGAPKIEAMKLINELEHNERGIYSGVLGWVGPSLEQAEFSVVIRSIILNKDNFEFQVGGGIVYDSNPEQELKETIYKAQTILDVLNLDEKIFY